MIWLLTTTTAASFSTDHDMEEFLWYLLTVATVNHVELGVSL